MPTQARPVAPDTEYAFSRSRSTTRLGEPAYVRRMRSKTLLATVLVTLGLASASASAATPLGGPWGYTSPDHAITVAFHLKGSPLKVEGFFVSSTLCNGGAPAQVTRKLPISSKGRFSFSGPAEGLSGEGKLTVNGRFVTRRLAKGTATVEGCGRIAFEAKLGG